MYLVLELKDCVWSANNGAYGCSLLAVAVASQTSQQLVADSPCNNDKSVQQLAVSDQDPLQSRMWLEQQMTPCDQPQRIALQSAL